MVLHSHVHGGFSEAGGSGPMFKVMWLMSFGSKTGSVSPIAFTNTVAP